MTAAEAACNASLSHLVSVHSLNESLFISSISNTTKHWLGLRMPTVALNLPQWTDDSPFSYNGFPTDPSNNSSAVCVAQENATWDLQSCTARLPYVCKRANVAVNFSCACTGQRDGNGAGQYCSKWAGNESLPWCYTSSVSFVLGVFVVFKKKKSVLVFWLGFFFISSFPRYFFS